MPKEICVDCANFFEFEILGHALAPRALRTPSSDNYLFLCDLCVFAGDNPIPKFGCGFAARGNLFRWNYIERPATAKQRAGLFAPPFADVHLDLATGSISSSV
jgi:hypothetical protein